eukprot:CAMPEP_0198154484 /NCGR_PEP_ID=MMETSP1443-20131203/68621_1 /TAXON_ID=186043 /ORGANISM="Entomoneis sp., Strain CCMP2396" /LENGTH=359 /DNA_ID=CAMNT_0043821163 /DNA_START=108 /DNA_END=1188 /DNA_ORIENTATION=-
MIRIAWSCVLAALFSVLSDILMFGAFSIHRNKSNAHNDWELFKQLDPTYIQEDWEVRREMFPLEVSAGIFNAVSWVILCIPLLQVTWHLSNNGSHLVGLHSGIVVLALTGVNAEFISHVLFIGSFSTMEWLTSDFNLSVWMDDTSTEEDPDNIGWRSLEVYGMAASDFNLSVWMDTSTEEDPDNIGWRSLEVTYMSIRGMLFWIEALEHLFLAVILFLLFLSIQRQDHSNKQKLSMAFGGYGLFLSLVCCIDFAFEVLRLRSWMTFAKLAFMVSVIGRIILWPIWLLWLGRQLAQDPQSALTPLDHGAEMVSYPSATQGGSAGESSGSPTINGNTSTSSAMPSTGMPSTGSSDDVKELS